MSKNILILMTDSYPFEKGESFLESEVLYYNKFDHIFIVPCKVRLEDSTIRPIPYKDKMTIINSKRKRGLWSNSVLWALSALFTKEFWLELFRLIKIRKFNTITIFQLISFIGKGERTYRHLMHEIHKENIQISLDDHVILYSYWMHWSAYAIVKIKKHLRNNSLAISRCHGYDLYEYRYQSNYIPLRPWLLKNLDKICCISDNGKQYLIKTYPLERNDHIIVRRLGTLDYGVKQIKRNVPIFTIVSCAWLTPVKRVHLLIEALSYIKDVQIQWIHFGGGILYDELVRKAKIMLKENISFDMKGSVDNVDVINFYKNTDVHLFINTSESEGVPVSIMEALSFGIPVIATNVGGTSEIVMSGENGILLEKDFEISELVEAIKYFINMPEQEYDEMRKRVRAIWEERCSAEKNYSNFVMELLNNGSV